MPRTLDELQAQLGTGPCLQAIREQETVHIPDLTAETRWPPFTAAALGLGVGSMLSFQLYTDGDNLGALTLYGAAAHAFGRDAHDAGVALATHAAIALIGAQRQSQWESALASRDIIGQAKGMLMERYQIDALRAFDLAGPVVAGGQHQTGRHRAPARRTRPSLAVTEHGGAPGPGDRARNAPARC